MSDTPIYDQLVHEQEQQCAPESPDDTGPNQPNPKPGPDTGTTADTKWPVSEPPS